MRLLLAEDNRRLAEGLKLALQQQGHALDWVVDGQLADDVLKTDHFDLVILDIGLPKLDGLTILKRLRARGTDTPVLILTAQSTLQSRVQGLDLGADDYMTKPFDLPELEARIRALLRRSSQMHSAEIVLGKLHFNSGSRAVNIDGQALELPRRELSLLEILLHRAGKVVSKEQIAEQLFSFDDEAGPNAIEIYVCRLRKKLAPAGVNIRTIRGLGYLLKA